MDILYGEEPRRFRTPRWDTHHLAITRRHSEPRLDVWTLNTLFLDRLSKRGSDRWLFHLLLFPWVLAHPPSQV